MAITIVQTATSNTSTATFGSNTTAGNTIIACIGAIGGATASTVSGTTLGGSAGNFGSLISTSATNGFSTSELASIWADPTCAGGQTSVAVTTSGATTHTSVVAYEIAGLLATATAASLLDVSSSSNGTSGTSFTSNASGTSTKANEIQIGVAACNATPTGPSSPWTTVKPGTDSVAIVAGYNIVSTTQTATYSGTMSGSTIWAAVVVSLFAQPSGGGLLMLFP